MLLKNLGNLRRRDWDVKEKVLELLSNIYFFLIYIFLSIMFVFFWDKENNNDGDDDDDNGDSYWFLKIIENLFLK